MLISSVCGNLLDVNIIFKEDMVSHAGNDVCLLLERFIWSIFIKSIAPALFKWILLKSVAFLHYILMIFYVTYVVSRATDIVVCQHSGEEVDHYTNYTLPGLCSRLDC